MKRLLAALLFLLAAPALAQVSMVGAPCTMTDGSCAGVLSSFPAPPGCVSTSVPFFGSDLKLTCDGGITYATATKTLTVGALAANNVTATALATPGSITVANVLTKVASITTVAGSALVDGDYFTVKYGPGLTIPVEFDLSPGDGTTGGKIPLLFAAGDSADTIRDNIITLLNAAAPASITASSGGAATVSIVLDTPGAVGDTNTENVANAGFTVSGFADPTHATTVTYKLVALLPDGTTTEAGAASTTTTAAATLSASNFNRLTWSAVTGASSYRVYRTVAPTTPNTTGIIYSGTALTVDDTGLAGGGETAPTVNGTGVITASRFVGAGVGISNSAGANVIPKSDGTNLVASALSEASAGVFATSAGTALSFAATAPAATTGASQVGKAVTITASPAVASTDTAGAAAGGDITITTGNAARNASGDANGGSIDLVAGTGIGNGVPGHLKLPKRIYSPSGYGRLLFTNDGPSLGRYGMLMGAPLAGVGYGISLAGGGGAGYFGFASAVNTATGANPEDVLGQPTTLWRSKGVASPAWGFASSTPVAYTHTLAADGAGADKRGAKATLTPGIGTGTGGSGDINVQTAYPAGMSSTLNTPTDRQFFGSLWTTLTESSATNLAALTFGASTAIGAEFLVTIEANDGTEYQSLTSRVRVSSVRKSTGNTVSAVGVVGTDLLGASTGTLTVTFAVTEGAAAATLTANAVSSLTQTTLRASIQAVANGPVVISQL